MKLQLTEEGLVEGTRYVASPNCDERPAGCAVELIVIHSISLPPGKFGGRGIEALFTNRLDTGSHPYYATLGELRVSAHFLIRRDGGLVQFVPCTKRAWHAGVSSWNGRPRCNDYSIGIEMEGTDHAPFADAQYETLALVTRALRARYPIGDLVGHSDVAPGRKTDPGPHFDWARYRALLDINRQGAKPVLSRAEGAARKNKTAAPPRRTQSTRRKKKAARRRV